MKILLGGIPLGCDNIGDEAIIACVVKMLKESIPGVECTVSTADPATAANLGVNVVPVFGFLDVGGLSDWLIPGETGLFAKAPNGQTRVHEARTPATLAAALDQMADPQKLKYMSGHALDTVARLFDPDRFLAGLLDFSAR